MSDRSLLEDAAKAAGIEVRRGNGFQKDRLFQDTPCNDGIVRGMEWNSLTNDGDCARLETACRLGVIWGDGFVTVGNDRSGLRSEAFEEHAGDENAARRRASTRAAAAISSQNRGVE